MGYGNWFPGTDLDDCRVIYVDYSLQTEHFDEDLQQFRWIDLKCDIRRLLPPSFEMVTDEGRGQRLPEWLCTRCRNDVPLAYNELYVLWCDGQGEPHHMGLGFTIREDAPAYAKARFDQIADKLFSGLNEMYECSVRAGAWCSAPYKAPAPSL